MVNGLYERWKKDIYKVCKKRGTSSDEREKGDA
jgi:hypothetical protein